MASNAEAPAAPGKKGASHPRYVEVESVLDFSRLACALERIPRVTFLHEHGGRTVLSAQVDALHDTPIIYYAPLEEGEDKGGSYLSYALRDGREESGMSESAGDASSTYSPIVRVRSLPASLGPDSSGAGGEMYHPVVLEDMASLARLSYAFEDSPFPLFAFPREGGWLVGMFMTFSDDGASYFCHVRSGEGPAGPFLRFSTGDGASPPSFVGAPDEHGYNYAKVIRLRGAHPLVDYAQLQGED